MLNVGIIGCGRIAEHHLRYLRGTAGVRVVGLSDTFIANARRMAGEHGVEHAFASHEELLGLPSLDAVHILTPPEFHYRQASDAIARGVHVLLEKPCTFHVSELEDLYRAAKAKSLVLCPDFIQLFVPPFLKARTLVDSGALGAVTHVDIQLGFDLIPPEVQEAVGLHWSFTLPGGVLHNNLTHPLYLALYWVGSLKKLSVVSRASGRLPQELTDHLLVTIEGSGCTANLLLTGAAKPDFYSARIFCEGGTVAVNFLSSSVTIDRHGVLPGFIKRAVDNFLLSGQLVSEATKNIYQYARGRLLPYQGMERLIPAFYDSIKLRTPPPISKELAIAVTRAEEAIVAQAGKLHLDTRDRPSSQTNLRHSERVLVTGAAGYIGSVLTQRLVDEGYYVRALVRPLSRIGMLEKLGVEVLFGDVRDPKAVAAACQGMEVVVHAAAALRGSAKLVFDAAVEGTKNVARAAKESGVKRVVYLSSMSVYDFACLRAGETITEKSRLEEKPEERGAYSLAKRRAEEVALECLAGETPAWTIIRPSVVVGRGYDLFSPIGKRVGNLLIGFDSPKKLLRMIHVEDLAAAIVELIRKNETKGHVYNLSNRGLAQRDYIDRVLKQGVSPNLRVIYLPYWMMRGIAGVSNLANRFLKFVPRIGPHRLAYLYCDAEVGCRPIGDCHSALANDILDRLRTEAK